MKRTLFLMLLTFCLCGTVYAAGSNWNGFATVKVTSAGKEVKVADPAIQVKGKTYVPISILKQLGLVISGDSKSVNVDLPKPKEPDKSVQASKTPLTIDQVKELGNRVALIYSLDSSGKRTAQGSGFIINSRGLLITAYHVAERGGQLQKLEVQLNGKTYFVPAGVYVFADKQKDIFGVYLQDPDLLPFLNVSDQLPDKFDDVFVIGNPAGKRNDISDGYVTAVFSENGRQYVSGVYDAYPGASGSPLLNQFGEVIGIISGGSGNVSVSTSINDAIALYKQTF